MDGINAKGGAEACGGRQRAYTVEPGRFSDVDSASGEDGKGGKGGGGGVEGEKTKNRERTQERRGLTWLNFGIEDRDTIMNGVLTSETERRGIVKEKREKSQSEAKESNNLSQAIREEELGHGLLSVEIPTPFFTSSDPALRFVNDEVPISGLLSLHERRTSTPSNIENPNNTPNVTSALNTDETAANQMLTPGSGSSNWYEPVHWPELPFASSYDIDQGSTSSETQQVGIRRHQPPDVFTRVLASEPVVETLFETGSFPDVLPPHHRRPLYSAAPRSSSQARNQSAVLSVPPVVPDAKLTAAEHNRDPALYEGDLPSNSSRIQPIFPLFFCKPERDIEGYYGW